jgi:hypothetical protein
MLILLPLLGACSPGPAIKPDPCAGWAVICPSKADILTDGTAKQILGHDEHGVVAKCWTRTACKSAKPDSAKDPAAGH